MCLLPPAGQQVRPDQERVGDVEHQPAGPDPPGRHHRSGHPLPFHVHPHHPQRHEAAEAPLRLGFRSAPPPQNTLAFNVLAKSCCMSDRAVDRVSL